MQITIIKNFRGDTQSYVLNTFSDFKPLSYLEAIVIKQPAAIDDSVNNSKIYIKFVPKKVHIDLFL